MSRQLITLCDSCAEKFKENYYLYPIGWVPGAMCTWAGCSNAPAMQYEFESKQAVRQQQNQHLPKRDTRAYYRGSWREEET